MSLINGVTTSDFWDAFTFNFDHQRKHSWILTIPPWRREMLCMGTYFRFYKMHSSGRQLASAAMDWTKEKKSIERVAKGRQIASLWGAFSFKGLLLRRSSWCNFLLPPSWNFSHSEYTLCFCQVPMRMCTWICMCTLAPENKEVPANRLALGEGVTDRLGCLPIKPQGPISRLCLSSADTISPWAFILFFYFCCCFVFHGFSDPNPDPHACKQAFYLWNHLPAPIPRLTKQTNKVKGSGFIYTVDTLCSAVRS